MVPVEITAFGLLAGSALAALAVSPVVSGMIAAASMPAVFVLDAAIAAAVAAAVRWRMAGTHAVGGPAKVVE